MRAAANGSNVQVRTYMDENAILAHGTTSERILDVHRSRDRRHQSGTDWAKVSGSIW